MKVIVKNIERGTKAGAGSDEDWFISPMEAFIGKTINVVSDEKGKWYWHYGKYRYHKSWLIFKKRSKKCVKK